MRRSAVADCRTVLEHFDVDPAEGRLIDVGGTRIVYLDDAFRPNPVLEWNPNVETLDRGFNIEEASTSADHVLDFLETAAIEQLRDTFDLVLTFDTLEHISEPFVFADHLVAITKPGGYFYAATVFSWPYHPSPEDYFRFSPSGLQLLFTTEKLRDQAEVLWCGWGTDRRGVALFGRRRNGAGPVARERSLTFESLEDLRGEGAGEVVQRRGLRRKLPKRARSAAWRALRPVRRRPRIVRTAWGGSAVTWHDVMGANLRRGDYDTGERLFLESFLRPGMCVVDVGAHSGFYTLLAASRVGRDGRILAFEPSARERRRLRLNLLLNRVRTAEVIAAAVGERTGRTEFHVVRGIETGFSSIRRPALDEPVQRVEVPIVTLDDQLRRAGIEAVDFLKLDVEGGELSVLRGAATLWEAAKRPVVLCELADSRTAAWGYRAVDIYDFLAERRYTWFSVDCGGQLQAATRQSAFHGNLVAVPAEALDDVVPGAVEGVSR